MPFFRASMWHTKQEAHEWMRAVRKANPEKRVPNRALSICIFVVPIETRPLYGKEKTTPELVTAWGNGV